MKIALISDIHSNLFYLKKALRHIDKYDVECIYCLGDLVGFYDEPNETIGLIRSRGIVCVKGNHDKYILSEADYNQSKECIYRIKVQRKIISAENMSFLKNLPDELEIEIAGKNLYLTHSLPSDTTTYVYETNKLDKEFTNNYDYYCLGHTHVPLISYFYGTCVVNPGSVGQPRDYTHKPSFAVLDLVNERHTLIKVDVDTLNYTQRLQEKNFDTELIDILNRGKNE